MGDRTPHVWDRGVRLSKGGHRIFVEAKTGRWAIADNSGHRPEQTEDGVLWIDRSRAVEVDVDSNGAVKTRVPVTYDPKSTPQLSGMWTGGPAEDAEVLFKEIPGLRIVITVEALRLRNILNTITEAKLT